jgi:hypothetical protein
MGKEPRQVLVAIALLLAAIPVTTTLPMKAHPLITELAALA